MKDGYETDWNVVCCKNNKGACEHCSAGTLAYVLSWNNSVGKTSETWVRFCPDGLNPSYEDAEIGITLFHELIHVTSRVPDHPTHAYVKTDMFSLAKSDPVGARMNADSYTMYVAQTGLNRDKFT